MSRIIGLVLLVLAIWIGASLMSGGSEHVLQGVFSSVENDEPTLPERASESLSRIERTARHVDTVIQDGAARYDEMLDQ